VLLPALPAAVDLAHALAPPVDLLTASPKPRRLCRYFNPSSSL
jgi:hypothetical protein